MKSNACWEIAREKLYWRGILTQAMSLELGGEVLNVLRDRDSLAVNLAGVEFLDFSSLVLLCSMKRHANEKGKILSLEGLENPVVAAEVQRYRSTGSRLCRTYCGNSCLFDCEN